VSSWSEDPEQLAWKGSEIRPQGLTSLWRIIYSPNPKTLSMQAKFKLEIYIYIYN
jgi:hypothetical protein